MALTAREIDVSLGKAAILKSVSLSAQAGQVTAIVGPNGSGKTTLLRALTGELPARGTIHLNGLNIAQLSPLDLACARAVLPQSGSVAFPFSVLELVRLGLIAGGVVDGRETLPHQALARVGLAGFEGRMVQDLSGGERQRAQLARVLVQIWEPLLDDTPRWLFLDEPVSALDIGHQLVVMGIARDYARAGGGVIAVLHDLNLTAMFADQVVLMGQGQVQAQGTPRDVLNDRDLSACYGCALRTNALPPKGGMWILPQTAGAA